ncbi:hypothetical protein VDG1235_238 [Verrucomicrobiia bacterium DG1235]|nr:hypothetical protein VDG1235_238 [Verrucomicrobiae bacterium DG1235]
MPTSEKEEDFATNFETTRLVYNNVTAAKNITYPTPTFFLSNF